MQATPNKILLLILMQSNYISLFNFANILVVWNTCSHRWTKSTWIFKLVSNLSVNQNLMLVIYNWLKIAIKVTWEDFKWMNFNVCITCMLVK